MSLFRAFPRVQYLFARKDKPIPVEFIDLTASSRLFSQLGDAETVYQYYQVVDGERPDVVSQKLYKNPDYYWTFYALNPSVRLQGWPLSYDELKRKMEEDLPGQCLVFLPQEEANRGADTNWIQHSLVDRFPVGKTIKQVQGSSEARGIIYGRDVNLGQLFVKLTTTRKFIEDIAIQGVDTETPNVLIPRMVYSPAYLAPSHFINGDGIHVDVDFSLDFRGRGPEAELTGLPEGAGPFEDGNALGGVWDDPVYPDPFSSSSPYTMVTFLEKYEIANESLSRLKVLKPSAVSTFVELYEKSLSQ